jgi:hypothetical protein
MADPLLFVIPERAAGANPESSGDVGLCFWIPGPAPSRIEDARERAVGAVPE